jgi:hypothetical protein
LKKSYKLALLICVIVISLVPITHFLLNDYAKGADNYILQLFHGNAWISIDVPNNSFMIISYIMLGIYETDLSYIIVVLGSTVAFFVSLILIALVEVHAITKRIVPLKSAFHL